MTDGGGRVPLDPVIADGIAHLFDATPADVLNGVVDGVPVGPDLVVDGVSWTADTVPAGHGPAVPVRIYRPDDAGDDLLPVVVWAHGGGWQYGSLEMPEAHTVGQRLALLARAAVVSVDYRLGTANRHPAARDDILGVVDHLCATAAARAIVPDRMVLGGASAGAQLVAAANAVLARRSRQPSGLCLVYPPTDPVHGAYTDRDTRCPAVAWLDRDTTTAIFLAHVPSDVGAEDLRSDDGTLVPAAGDLRRYPPTLVTTADADGLTRQARDFVAALEAAGVAIAHHHVDGVIHGYLNLLGLSPHADAALERHAAWIRGVLHA